MQALSAELTSADARAAMAYRSAMEASTSLGFPLQGLPLAPTHPAVRGAALREALAALSRLRQEYGQAHNAVEALGGDEDLAGTVEHTRDAAWMAYARCAAYVYLLSPTSTRQRAWEKRRGK